MNGDLENSGSDLRERLAAAILVNAAPSASAAAGDHPDDNDLAAFCLGTLPQDRRDSIVEHLADCDECRECVAEQLRALDEEQTPPAVVPAARSTTSMAVAAVLFVLAASIVVILTLPGGPGRSRTEAEYFAEAETKLRESKFADVRSLTDEAIRNGVGSLRIHNLRGQAAREIPNASALAFAGRITDFGYELGGVEARGQKPDAPKTNAEQELAAAGDDMTAVLNRGHLALSENRPDEAAKSFQTVIDRDRDNGDAWLGLGLARFMANDFVAAEQAFGEALKRKPGDLAASWNQAMTLEELGRFEEATKAWRVILPLIGDEAERRKLEQHIKQLEPPGN